MSGRGEWYVPFWNGPLGVGLGGLGFGVLGSLGFTPVAPFRSVGRCPAHCAFASIIRVEYIMPSGRTGLRPLALRELSVPLLSLLTRASVMGICESVKNFFCELLRGSGE